MLHQPSTTFQPSKPVTSFDPKAYIARARELGLTIFPTINDDGSRTYGLTAYEPNRFGPGHRKLVGEYDSAMEDVPGSTRQVFDALCDDFGVNPADPTFHEQINALCRRENQRLSGERKLLALCRRAEKVVAEDGRLEDRLSELDDSFMLSQRDVPRPVAEGIVRFLPSHSSKEMRAHVRERRAEYTKAHLDQISAHIAAVATWEKERHVAQIEHGLIAARRESAAINAKTHKLVEELSEIEATTAAGLAAKSRVMLACLRIGYGFDSGFKDFANSIFRDAAALDAPSPGSRRRTGEPCAQQVHH